MQVDEERVAYMSVRSPSGLGLMTDATKRLDKEMLTNDRRDKEVNRVDG